MQCGECDINNRLNDDETRLLLEKLDDLRIEHRDLDDVLHHLAVSAYPDQIQMQRIKKRKLKLKDQIKQLESRLIPDIDA